MLPFVVSNVCVCVCVDRKQMIPHAKEMVKSYERRIIYHIETALHRVSFSRMKEIKSETRSEKDSGNPFLDRCPIYVARLSKIFHTHNANLLAGFFTAFDFVLYMDSILITPALGNGRTERGKSMVDTRGYSGGWGTKTKTIRRT